jgi:hypothetical protein
MVALPHCNCPLLGITGVDVWGRKSGQCRIFEGLHARSDARFPCASNARMSASATGLKVLSQLDYFL